MNRPDYYKKGRTHEPKDVIKAFRLEFNLGNTVKYIARAGHKPGEPAQKDLDKALTYLQFEIDDLQKAIQKDPYNVYQKYVEINDDMYEIYVGLVLEDWGIDKESDLGKVLNYIFDSSRHPFAKDILTDLEKAALILKDWNATGQILEETHKKAGYSEDYISGWNAAMDDVLEYYEDTDDVILAGDIKGHCKTSKM